MFRNPEIFVSHNAKNYALRKLSLFNHIVWNDEIPEDKDTFYSSVIRTFSADKPYQLFNMDKKLYFDDKEIRFSREEIKKYFQLTENPKSEILKSKYKEITKKFGIQPEYIKRVRISADNRYVMFLSQNFGFKILLILNLNKLKRYYIPLGFDGSLDYQYAWINKGKPTIIINESTEHRENYYYEDEISKHYKPIYTIKDIENKYKKNIDFLFKFPFSLVSYFHPGYKLLRKRYFINEQDNNWYEKHFKRYYKEFQDTAPTNRL